MRAGGAAPQLRVGLLGRCADADPDLDTRNDVLALMLRNRYDDGSPMTRAEIADELITFLAAGHETTATTLAWIVERIQSHPQLLDRLVADIDNGSDELLNATILEVQRSRPAIDSTLRKVMSPRGARVRVQPRPR
jgi:cytochrome P450 family 138